MVEVHETPDLVAFRERIADLVARSGLSVPQLAKSGGIPVRSLQRTVRSEKVPTAPALSQLFGALERSRAPVPKDFQDSLFSERNRLERAVAPAVVMPTIPAPRATDEPDIAPTVPRRSRRTTMILYAATPVLVVAVAATAFAAMGTGRRAPRPQPASSVATRTPQSAGCAEVGFRYDYSRRTVAVDPRVRSAFVAAYDAAGGRSRLGCPRTGDGSGFVHAWGPGVSQDLQGSNGLPARIMQLPTAAPVVLEGQLNREYTALAGGDTGPLLGYPTSSPRACGRDQVVELSQPQLRFVSGLVLPGGEGTWRYLDAPGWQRYVSRTCPSS